jgi:transposase
MPSKRCFCSAFPPSALDDEVTEADEVYVNAGEKGRRHPDPADPPRRRANKRRGHGTWNTDRPPIGGVVGRGSSQVRVRVLRHADSVALRSLVEAATTPTSTVNTDEWRGYWWLNRTAHLHPTVNHAPGQREWARDDDGDGVREVHVNTLEGLWTGVRNFLRPFRGVSQHYLSQYLAVFEWAHNLKRITANLIPMMLRPFTSEPT